ncbi:response regulator [Aurantimonas aggregata]|uniref:DNA-binding transcriptional regulator NtrC n=1 Tax=Aurantimonas aggregata TaxID=2047720 RepID=A0A6L9MH25_9HYPH|nr:response regulator [Aurantimonas aggregata]
MSRTVLIVDDDPIQRRLLDAQVARMGYTPICCAGGRTALDALDGKHRGSILAVVLDLMMPDSGGLDVLAEMRRQEIEIPVVVQTAKGSIETVVEAMRAGAFDFLVKPFSPEKLRDVLGSAARMQAAPRRPVSAARTRKLLAETNASPALRPVLLAAAKAARSAIPVLIEGETGAGKEWLAAAIQAEGDRAERPFVTLNCGAIPADLAESILFGHEKGAFTDAGRRHDGKFLQAEGGTLFLDEVGELSMAAQVKLLRVLQTGEVDLVGGSARRRVDVRIISATNRSLAAAVATGRFREDLYYRLNAFEIHVPPLRERRDEISHLASGCLERFGRVERQAPGRRLSRGALDLLQRYDWPGNIRQLENAVYRALVLSESEILEAAGFAHVAALVSATSRPAAVVSGSAPDDASEPNAVPSPTSLETDVAPTAFPLRDEAGQIRRIDDIEADVIRVALCQYGGQMSEIARRLGIGRSTLYRKMREYNIGA